MLHQLGHEQWTCKEQGMVVTLAVENHFDLLVIMPTYEKFVVFMISLMVIGQTVIMVVPLVVLNGHEAYVK